MKWNNPIELKLLNLNLDLRNKFGQLHNQNSPNRERELFSACLCATRQVGLANPASS